MRTAEQGFPWCELAAEDDKQSATALRSGSGGFLNDEDLNLDRPPTPPSWNLELPPVPGLQDGLKLEDMVFFLWAPNLLELAVRIFKQSNFYP